MPQELLFRLWAVAGTLHGNLRLRAHADKVQRHGSKGEEEAKRTIQEIELIMRMSYCPLLTDRPLFV